MSSGSFLEVRDAILEVPLVSVSIFGGGQCQLTTIYGNYHVCGFGKEVN